MSFVLLAGLAIAVSPLVSVAREEPGPPQQVYLRAFKHERVLEVWTSAKAGQAYVLAKSYVFTAASGTLGPKRREGDKQVPEGFYVVDRFNPHSKYHLSLGLNYPNESDRKRSDPAKPGGDIFIHGKAVSIGCIAIGDAAIEEVYALCKSAVKASGRKVRVDIFPFKMTNRNMDRWKGEFPQHESSWKELAPGYAGFERSKMPVKFTVDRTGSYKVG